MGPAPLPGHPSGRHRGWSRAGETGYYGYNAHTDVETVTDDAGRTVATYGYTAYGENDEAEFTGIDKPDAATPGADGELYNAYRFNSKRWDAGSGTYDMGFRDYNRGLNTFTTRDMYNGALADMGLGTDPFTSNRYAFAAGNPISGIEYDGHMLLDSPGGGGDAPAPTNSPGCGTWGLPACDTAPKTEPLPWVPVSTGDGGDVLGGAANSAIELSGMTPFAGLVNALGLTDYARDTVNEELDVDTTTKAYAAGEITFDVVTAFVGGGGGLAAKGTKTLASGGSEAAQARLINAVNDRAEQIVMTQSGNERGPVLSGVMDRGSGQIAFGQNTGVPDNLHPALQARLDSFDGPGAPFKGIPGSHAEVNAVNELLFARPDATIADMMVFNLRLKGSKTGWPIVMCDNCAQILRGAEDLS